MAQLQLAEENENAVDRLVQELGCPTRRIRQFAARVLHLLAERDPQRVVPCVPALIEALDRPEAQTRWEALDALAALATTCPEQLGDAFEGAETALFDEISSTLRYAAFRLLCVWGSTSVERSREAWPILDEAIQCYHGDPEYRDMLVALLTFVQGAASAATKAALAERLKFDAENGASYVKSFSAQIIQACE
ncbi:MAG: hypothetical protein JTJ24_08015 [Collinsella sp.]|nr:hypothetical protein [Collinsella sp.]